MKNVKYGLVLVTIFASLFLWSCSEIVEDLGEDPKDPTEVVEDDNSAEEGNKESPSDVGYNGFYSDVVSLFELVYRKETLEMNLLSYVSENFEKEPFAGKVTKEQYESFFDEYEKFMSDSVKYQNALANLNESGVLEESTLRGIFTSFIEFWKSFFKAKEDQRKHTLEVWNQLSERERETLYNSLDKKWKKQASSKEDFKSKLEKGDFDDGIFRIYNDFYHQGETDFDYYANELKGGHAIGMTVKKVGAEMIDKGKDLAMDCSTDVPVGMAVTVTNLAKNTKKMVESKSIKDAIQSRFKITADILKEIVGYNKNPWFNPADVVSIISDKIDNFFFNSDSKDEKKGMIVVKDKNKEAPTTLVIASRKKDDTESIFPRVYVLAKDYVDKGLDIVLKSGKWLITTVGQNGRRITQEVDLNEKQVIELTVDTSKPKFQTWSELVKLHPRFNPLPAFDKNISSIDLKEDDNEGVEITSWVNVTFQEVSSDEFKAYISKLNNSGYPVKYDEDLGYYLGVLKDKPNEGETLNVVVEHKGSTMLLSLGITKPDDLDTSKLNLYIRAKIYQKAEEMDGIEDDEKRAFWMYYHGPKSFGLSLYDLWVGEGDYSSMKVGANGVFVGEEQGAVPDFLNLKDQVYLREVELQFDDPARPTMIKRLYFKETINAKYVWSYGGKNEEVDYNYWRSFELLNIPIKLIYIATDEETGYNKEKVMADENLYSWYAPWMKPCYMIEINHNVGHRETPWIETSKLIVRHNLIGENQYESSDGHFDDKIKCKLFISLPNQNKH